MYQNMSFGRYHCIKTVEMLRKVLFFFPVHVIVRKDIDLRFDNFILTLRKLRLLLCTLPMMMSDFVTAPECL